MNLKSNVTEIAGIGEVVAGKLANLGIVTVEDMLWHFPRRWDDYSNILPINQIKIGQAVSVRGRIAQIENKRTSGGRYVTHAVVSDGTGLIKAVWFNQPFLTQNIHIDDEIFLAGTVEFNYGSIQMQSPSYEKMSEESGEATHVGRIVPVYPETAGVTSKWLRSKIKLIMKYIYSIKDYLPDQVKKDEGLLDLPAAIRQMHFPENETQLERARERIDFDQMFLLQTAVLGSKQRLKRGKSIAVPFDEELIKNFVQNIGFDLTVAQKKASWDILQDIAKAQPMNRLLQGDVGSGKTVVATMAMLNVAAAGSQAVLLCPTEILAKQHYAKIANMLAHLEIPCGLLTSSTLKDEKKILLAKIKEGEIKIIIGTHAVLEKNVEFWRLALAIVDEQHRFGVDQRAALKKESLGSDTEPHFLAMTATPIPRTLSLTVYGDLDVSIIYELPKGRQKVVTRIVPEEKREASCGFIRKQVEEGRQVYVVCSLVLPRHSEQSEESSNNTPGSFVGTQDDNISVFDLPVEKLSKSEISENEHKSVMDEYERLSHKIFPDIKVGYIHGQMKNAEKELMMSKFISGEIKILVSSSVIEVGVDVPNATVMMIESAERFGLAQLHQFRGRVGRGVYQSYCLLFTSSKNEIAHRRLEALVHTDNGFKLADTDLEIRGPGDFIGGRQHGLPDISMRNFMNTTLITRTREAAKHFLSQYNLEEFPMLAAKTEKYSSVLTLE